MKILITGTAGFIGYHLSKKLIERGDTVIGVDQINDYYDIQLKYSRLKDLGIEKNEIEEGKKITSSTYDNHSFYKGNIEDKDFIDAVFKKEKPDAVCNLAAQAGVRYSLINPQAYIDSNIVGFINILEACRHNGVENLSYASSSSVYGLNKSLPFSTKDNVDHPVSLYAASKKSNELMAHTYSHLFGIRTTGLRFFTVYGPFGRPDMALFLFAKAALENDTIDVFNHGEMVRDFTYVDDIVKGIISVIDNPAESSSDFETNPTPNTSSAPYRVYNIGNNNPVKLMDFITAIEKKIGKTVKKNFMEIQPGDVPQTFADVTDLERDFNYKPNTSIDFGISKFIDWYKDYYGIS
ncbi:NAD-dependent epimerase [Flavobacteriaceae bacterium]|nr:NAD-dependent epimerase [Flavobacteriaceae bacterium]